MLETHFGNHEGSPLVALISDTLKDFEGAGIFRGEHRGFCLAADEVEESKLAVTGIFLGEEPDSVAIDGESGEVEVGETVALRKHFCELFLLAGAHVLYFLILLFLVKMNGHMALIIPRNKAFGGV